jgi:hypothetical protein
MRDLRLDAAWCGGMLRTRNESKKERNFMKTMIRAVSLSGLLSFLLLTSGCAFGTRHAKLTYPPGALSEKAATNACPAGSKGRIVLQRFSDDRANKRLVGHVRNGWGMKTAEVVSDDGDLSDLITGAVRSELQKAGYEVLSDAAAGGLPQLAGGLTAMYCDAYLTYEGKATLVVRVNRDGNEVFKRTYEGQGSAGLNWTMSSASYGKSLSVALQEAILALVADLPTALKQ